LLNDDELSPCRLPAIRAIGAPTAKRIFTSVSCAVNGMPVLTLPLLSRLHRFVRWLYAENLHSLFIAENDEQALNYKRCGCDDPLCQWAF